jgi:hypothetical protein
MVEYDLAKILERLEQKIDKVIESQARQEEQIKSLQKGQDETKDIRKDIKGRVAIQTYRLLVLMTFLIGLVVKFAFWPINNP